MAIQHRRGQWSDFDPSKLLPGEGAYILGGDPNSVDGQSVYFCFNAGNVKRMATYEDMVQNIQNATSDIQQLFTQELTQTLNAAESTLGAMNEAITEAEGALTTMQNATSAANSAAQAANEAAETAESVVDDIGNTPITFTQAAERTNLATGDTVKTAFGKIVKWFADLGVAAFQAVANNLTTTEEGSVLDARQGKVLDESKLNKEGDASNTTAAFEQATSRANISTGETLATIFGKVMKYFADLGAAAFQAVANNLTTTTAGSVLDARQGKTLSDTINGIRTDLGDPDNLNTSAKSNVVAAVNELYSKSIMLDSFSGTTDVNGRFQTNVLKSERTILAAYAVMQNLIVEIYPSSSEFWYFRVTDSSGNPAASATCNFSYYYISVG